MILCAATMDPAEGLLHEWMQRSARVTKTAIHRNDPPRYENIGVVAAYDAIYRGETQDPLFSNSAADEEILFYVHDDVACRENKWDERIMAEFDNPKVGVVGLGGALIHGDPNIYKVPYDYRQIGRFMYRSNVDDAEIHGERYAGHCDVATIDGFAFAVRRELLDQSRGWPVHTPVGYVGYDYWLTCMAHRLGYTVRMVGIRCHHYGGRTFTKLNLPDAQVQYEEVHRYIYREFADVLPWRCV